MASSKLSDSIKVTTYNVLSSHLCDPEHFTSCEPKWLDQKYRLEALKKKLDAEISQNSIICLQEVSSLWAGSLHTYFAERGYYFVNTLYGSKFNGYMGVGIAIPISKYKIDDVNITKVSDTKKFAKPPSLPAVLQFAKSWVIDPILNILRNISVLRPLELTPWQLAAYRNNQMVCMALSPISDDPQKKAQKFVVGTYHMPCMFRSPSVMMIHCSLSARHIQKFANGLPLVYCGDFNIKPPDTMYKLLTNGSVDSKHPDMPPPEEGQIVDLSVQPMRSAYVEASPNREEPKFTNCAQVRQEPEFIETLDYIFLSKEWKVEAVQELPSREQLGAPLPIEGEPSDHLLLSATLTLP